MDIAAQKASVAVCISAVSDIETVPSGSIKTGIAWHSGDEHSTAVRENKGAHLHFNAKRIYKDIKLTEWKRVLGKIASTTNKSSAVYAAVGLFEMQLIEPMLENTSNKAVCWRNWVSFALFFLRV